jgi:CRISPR type I-E-associated protein CasA/Cse1
LYEPWIPVLDAEGNAAYTGIEGALNEAHKWTGIHDPFPVVSVGIIRLLLAVTYRVLGPISTVSAWQHIRDAGQFPTQPFDEYFSRWRSHFDLLGSTPFYQDAGSRTDTDLRPVCDLFLERCADTNINLMSHDYDNRTSMALAECARALVSLPAFCLQGGQGKQAGINDAPPTYLFLTGRTLFESLLLNLPVNETMPDNPVLGRKGDAPRWEDRHGTTGSVGYLEAFTFLPRKASLLVELAEDGVPYVRQTVFKKLEMVRERRQTWKEPHAVHDTKTGKTLRPPNPIKVPVSAAQYWRDLWTRMLDVLDGNDGASCPILKQFQALAPVTVSSVSLWIVSLSAKQALALDVQDRLITPTADFWHSTEWRSTLRQGLQAADGAGRKAWAQGRACGKRRDKKTGPNTDIARLERQGESVFLHAVEDGPHDGCDLRDQLLACWSTKKPSRGSREDMHGTDGISTFVQALETLSAHDLTRIRQSAGSGRGASTTLNDLFNVIWRPLKHRGLWVPREALFLVFMTYPWNALRGTPHDFPQGLRAVWKHTAKTSKEDLKRHRAYLEGLLGAVKGTGYETSLLQAVRLLCSEQIAINWEMLARDIANWEIPGLPVQNRWRAVCFPQTTAAKERN